MEKEELISQMVHNFLIPEPERKALRQKIKLRQEYHLQLAHYLLTGCKNATSPDQDIFSGKKYKYVNRGKYAYSDG
jgi:hypothetical protein